MDHNDGGRVMTREEAIEVLKNNGEYDRTYIGEQKSRSQEAIDMAIAALEAELATKTCNKQITSKLEDAELARDSEETCNNKQVISKLIASEDNISGQVASEKEDSDIVDRAINTLSESKGEDAVNRAMQVLVNHGYITLDADTIVLTPDKDEEPCEYAISQSDVIDAIGSWMDSGENCLRGNAERYLIDRIKALPPVTPKQRTGHWIYKNKLCGSIKHYEGTDEVTGEPRKIWVDDRVYADMPYCSECGSLAGDTSLNYCCVCGAKMVEPQERSDKA